MPDGPYTLLLGIAQDAGYPQAGTKTSPAWDEHCLRRLATCLALIDPRSGRRWLIDATPDFKEQLHRLDVAAPDSGVPGLDGIFLTHAHIGHYTGLIHLSREAIGSHNLPVYTMPRDVVYEAPALRSYAYTTVGNRVLVVDPGSHMVVDELY